MMRKNILPLAGCVLYLAALLLPLYGMVTGSGPDTDYLILNSRRLLLLANSLKLGGMSAFLSCTLGLLCGLFIHNSPLRDKWYRYFFVLFLPVPYYVYALSWMYLIRLLAGWWPWMLQYSIKGFGACLFVEGLTYLPLATLFILAALESVSAESEGMALVYRSPFSVLVKNILPETGPFLVAAFGCIFTFSVTDFSVPSMFQYNTYALEIFSVYGRTGNSLQACVMALPLFVVLLFPILFIAQGINRIGFPQPSGRSAVCRYPLALRTGMTAAFLIECLQVILPTAVFILYTEDAGTFIRSAGMIGEQLATSAEIALAATALALALSAGPAAVLARSRSIPLWTAVLMTLAFPGSLKAMGLLSAVNGSLIHGVSLTIFLPALGCAIHYMPYALLILTVAVRRLDRKRIEMAQVMTISRGRLAILVLRMLLPGILCAAGLIFFLTLGEEGIMLVLMPPGLETASVKIYNYLHYGASQYVSGFCLVIVAVILALELAAAAGLKLWRKRETK